MASQFTDAEFDEHVQRYGSKELDWEPFAAQETSRRSTEGPM